MRGRRAGPDWRPDPPRAQVSDSVQHWAPRSATPHRSPPSSRDHFRRRSRCERCCAVAQGAFGPRVGLVRVVGCVGQCLGQSGAHPDRAADVAAGGDARSEPAGRARVEVEARPPPGLPRRAFPEGRGGVGGAAEGVSCSARQAAGHSGPPPAPLLSPHRPRAGDGERRSYGHGCRWFGGCAAPSAPLPLLPSAPPSAPPFSSPSAPLLLSPPPQHPAASRSLPERPAASRSLPQPPGTHPPPTFLGAPSGVALRRVCRAVRGRLRGTLASLPLSSRS